MTAHHPISNATDSPSRSTLLGLPVGRVPFRVEGLGVRSMTKRQIEVTMFVAGVEKLEGLRDGKLVGIPS